MLTDRDIVTNALARESDLRSLVVEVVMTRNPVAVGANTPVDEALQRMRRSNARRVSVVDDRGRLIGILALDDIFDHMAQCVPFAATPIRPELRGEHSRDRSQPGSIGHRQDERRDSRGTRESKSKGLLQEADAHGPSPFGRVPMKNSSSRYDNAPMERMLQRFESGCSGIASMARLEPMTVAEFHSKPSTRSETSQAPALQWYGHVGSIKSSGMGASFAAGDEDCSE